MKDKERYFLEYGQYCINYEVIRKQVKNVNLNVKPNMIVSVSANQTVPLSFIEQLIKKRAQWIITQLKEFEQAQPEQINVREYVSGESYRYLGKQYRLKVFEVKNNKEECVKYLRGYINIYVKDIDDKVRKEKLLQDWYRYKADKIFNEILFKVYSKLENHLEAYPDLKFRNMKARWGSAHIKNNVILLNIELIKAPKSSIEYVILHELLHFIHNNHSKDFYTLLNVNMPDWKVRKHQLDYYAVKD